MNFSLEYTEGQSKFAHEVREWLDENVPDGLVTVRDTVKMGLEQWHKRRDFVRKLGQKGWLYPGYPKEYGGGGLDMDRCYVLSHELAERALALPPLYDVGILAAPAVLACGTEEQKRRFLPPIFRGEVLTWQLFTEPEAGTDEANQQTNALRSQQESDHFIINGQKIFVGSYPSTPNQFYLLTRSDLEAPRHQNLAVFLIPADLPGITVQALDLFTPGTFAEMSGPTAANAESTKHSVFFDDVKVHESYLIGGERDGWKVVNATLEVEHSGGFTSVIGRNDLVDSFLDQCKNDPNIFNRLKENPQLLDSLVNIYVDAQIERLFSIRNAWQTFSQNHDPHTGPQLALYSKNFGTRFIMESAKVLGPYAFTDDAAWTLAEGIFEVSQRSGVCLASSGTPEALKIGISRALGIGRG
jgi:alkylation response protein AidB-like acyl-CoA dehydrogenase